MARVETKLNWLMCLMCAMSLCLMFVINKTMHHKEPITHEICRRAAEGLRSKDGKKLPDVPEDMNAIRDKKEAIKEMEMGMDSDTPKADVIDKHKERERHKSNPKTPESLVTGSSNTSKAFRQYIKLRPDPVDPNYFRFIFSGKKICAGKSPVFLIILCVSKYFDADKRKVIRRTWASVAKTGSWPYGKGTFHVKLVFVLANPGTSPVKQAIVKEENDSFGDIVLVDIEESLQSQSKRLMAGLKWVSNHCSGAKFVLRVDEQTMVHIPNLVEYLKSFNIQQRGHVIGFVFPRTKTLRGGKWALNQTIYPFDLYPPYASGASYVISGNIVEAMFTAAERLPYIFIEDIFITGIVREAIGAEIKHKREFASKFARQAKLCDLHEKDRISITHVKPSLQLEIWRALHQTNCKEEK